jgi:small subunit ribosomal protein S17
MKIFEGIIISISNSNTAIVKMERMVPHPMYKKLIRKKSTFMTDTTGSEVKVGDKIKIVETKPISKGKTFKIYTSSQKEAAK